MQNTQQQFETRNTYTPKDASQVSGSVVLSLNREDTLGEQGLKTVSNNLDVNHSQHTGSSDLRVQNIVYVLNKRGNPLMPTTQQKANMMLKQKKAKVVKRSPFTIQLNYATGEATHPITLGIDSGYKWIGFSATTDAKELISGELKLRTDIVKKIEERKMYRRGRRNKLWYRQPRFLNRTGSKKKGWLTPSINHKLDTHNRLINKIKSILPVSKVVVEVASFDTQRMMNPEINGIEYQQGELQGYEIREYLLEKFDRTCVYCGKKDVPLQIEHIIPKSREGSNRVSNLTISCEKCNLKKNNMTAKEFGFPKIQEQAKKSLKATAFMNIVKKRLVEKIGCEYTYGYITKYNRIRQGLEKSHINDAFVISGGTIQKRNNYFAVSQTRRNNRCLQLNRKGFKPSIRRIRYILQPNDVVNLKNKRLIVKGVHSYGKYVLLSDSLNNKINTNIKEVELLNYGKGIIYSSLSSHD